MILCSVVDTSALSPHLEHWIATGLFRFEIAMGYVSSPRTNPIRRKCDISSHAQMPTAKTKTSLIEAGLI
jgi:hypothetical protein